MATVGIGDKAAFSLAPQFKGTGWNIEKQRVNTIILTVKSKASSSNFIPEAYWLRRE